MNINVYFVRRSMLSYCSVHSWNVFLTLKASSNILDSLVLIARNYSSLGFFFLHFVTGIRMVDSPRARVWSAMAYSRLVIQVENSLYNDGNSATVKVKSSRKLERGELRKWKGRNVVVMFVIASRSVSPKQPFWLSLSAFSSFLALKSDQHGRLQRRVRLSKFGNVQSTTERRCRLCSPSCGLASSYPRGCQQDGYWFDTLRFFVR